MLSQQCLLSRFCSSSGLDYLPLSLWLLVSTTVVRIRRITSFFRDAEHDTHSVCLSAVALRSVYSPRALTEGIRQQRLRGSHPPFLFPLLSPAHLSLGHENVVVMRCFRTPCLHVGKRNTSVLKRAWATSLGIKRVFLSFLSS